MSTWTVVLLAGGLALALKLLGYVVPERWLEPPRIARIVALLPVALLASLVVTQTLTVGETLVLDARLAGVAVGVVAFAVRAPFLVAVVLAAATAAGLRALGWG